MARNINSDSIISQLNSAGESNRSNFTKASHSFAMYISADGENFTLLSDGFINARTKNSVLKAFAESLDADADGETILLGGKLKIVVRTMREKKSIDLSSFA